MIATSRSALTIPQSKIGNPNLPIALWCNGNTAPFGGVILGSSPSGAATQNGRGITLVSALQLS